MENQDNEQSLPKSVEDGVFKRLGQMSDGEMEAIREVGSVVKDANSIMTGLDERMKVLEGVSEKITGAIERVSESQNRRRSSEEADKSKADAVRMELDQAKITEDEEVWVDELDDEEVEVRTDENGNVKVRSGVIVAYVEDENGNEEKVLLDVMRIMTISEFVEKRVRIHEWPKNRDDVSLEQLDDFMRELSQAYYRAGIIPYPEASQAAIEIYNAVKKRYYTLKKNTKNTPE